jgi:hypothetical protein
MGRLGAARYSNRVENVHGHEPCVQSRNCELFHRAEAHFTPSRRYNHPMTASKLTGLVFTTALFMGFEMESPEGRQAPAATRTPIDVSKLGPQVGHRVPDFALKDQNGKLWTRQSIVGPKGAMLVFVRSADW